MTRREEIMEEAKKHEYDWGVDVDRFDVPDIFAKGAEWANEIMIEKARQWFNLHFRQVGTPKEIKHDFESKEKMWKSFTQFMEE